MSGASERANGLTFLRAVGSFAAASSHPVGAALIEGHAASAASASTRDSIPIVASVTRTTRRLRTGSVRRRTAWEGQKGGQRDRRKTERKIGEGKGQRDQRGTEGKQKTGTRTGEGKDG